MHLVFDIGPQPDHRFLHGEVEQPGLCPNHQRCSQIQRQRQRQCSLHRGEVHTLARHHVHPGQQVGEGVVTTGPSRSDGLCLGDSPGSPRPITPLNSKSVAWPRIRGTMTPIVVPAIPSVITAMLSRRCGASRFTSRAADPQKSRDRMFGGGLAARGRAPGGAVTLHPRPWRSAIVRRRIRHRWGNRPAAFRGCPCRRSYRYRQR